MSFKYTGFIKSGFSFTCCFAMATSTFAQTVSEASYLEALANMAAEMNEASIATETPSVVSATILPQVDELVNGDLVDCEALAALAEGDQTGPVLDDGDQQNSDDYLAVLTSCYAESTGDLAATKNRMAMVSGS